jgi:hypothetical protein
MWWHDLEEIRTRIDYVQNSLLRIEATLSEATHPNRIDQIEVKVDRLQETLLDLFESEDEFSSLNRIHDKLNILVEDERRKECVELAMETLDKFEDYMKNVDKLNSMMNEFKGCVALARSVLHEKKKADASG